MAPPYHLRLFLDAGSGVCLWAQNDAARDRFGYAVDAQDLDLPPDVLEDVFRLIRDHDEGFNWNDPALAGNQGAPGPDPDTPFHDRIRTLAKWLREALGPGFVIETGVPD
jgi:hypothetical protein